MLNASFEEVLEDFKSNSIPTDRPGFYNHQNFINREGDDPEYLESYGIFVENKIYDSEYIARSKREVPFIAKLVLEELERDGKQGGCIEISMLLSKIFEAEGFWNYILSGGLVTIFPPSSGISTKYFYQFDSTNPKAKAGHAWCVVPPFCVVDITIKQQPYKTEEKEYFPSCIFDTNACECPFSLNDLICPELMHNQSPLEAISKIYPRLHLFVKRFKPIMVMNNDMIFKYVPCGVNVCSDTLEDMISPRLNDQSAQQLYEDIVKPNLEEFRYGQ